MTDHTRLVTFLGLGKPEPPHYDEVSYEMDGRVSARTPLVERALLELLPRVGHLVVLGTAEVRKRWFDTGLFEREVGRGARFVEIPDGSGGEGDLWRVFEVLVSHLSAPPLEGEDGSPAAVVLDVTHGYRVQPLFGMGALSYVVSDRKRKGPGPHPALRVTYGAYEARDKVREVAPIWDLTGFVTAAEWNVALDGLMRHGRADDLEALGADRSRREVADALEAGLAVPQLALMKAARRLGEKARALADDLATAHVPNLLTRSAPALRRALDEDEVRALVGRLPVLRGALEDLRGLLDPLVAPSVDSARGVRAMAHLVKWLGELQRFSEQALVLREALISHFGRVAGVPPGPAPGEDGFAGRRVDLERAWQRERHGPAEPPPDADPHVAAEPPTVDRSRPEVTWNFDLASRAVELRNQVAHCRFRDGSWPSKTVRDNLVKLADDFLRLEGIDDGGGDPPGEAR